MLKTLVFVFGGIARFPDLQTFLGVTKSKLEKDIRNLEKYHLVKVDKLNGIRMIRAKDFVMKAFLNKSKSLNLKLERFHRSLQVGLIYKELNKLNKTQYVNLVEDLDTNAFLFGNFLFFRPKDNARLTNGLESFYSSTLKVENSILKYHKQLEAYRYFHTQEMGKKFQNGENTKNFTLENYIISHEAEKKPKYSEAEIEERYRLAQQQGLSMAEFNKMEGLGVFNYKKDELDLYKLQRKGVHIIKSTVNREKKIMIFSVGVLNTEMIYDVDYLANKIIDTSKFLIDTFEVDDVSVNSVLYLTTYNKLPYNTMKRIIKIVNSKLKRNLCSADRRDDARFHVKNLYYQNLNKKRGEVDEKE